MNRSLLFLSVLLYSKTLQADSSQIPVFSTAYYVSTPIPSSSGIIPTEGYVQYVEAMAINNNGVLAGVFQEVDTRVDEQFGFTEQNGVYTPFTLPLLPYVTGINELIKVTSRDQSPQRLLVVRSLRLCLMAYGTFPGGLLAGRMQIRQPGRRCRKPLQRLCSAELRR